MSAPPSQQNPKHTGDNRYYTKQEREEAKIEFIPYAKELLCQPFIVIAIEPGILPLDTYNAVIYGCYYLFF